MNQTQPASNNPSRPSLGASLHINRTFRPAFGTDFFARNIDPQVGRVGEFLSSRDLRDRYFTYKLTEWTNEQNITLEETANRTIAARKIRECYAGNGTELSLANLRLSSLPDCLHFLSNLKTLDLEGNYLTSFDPSQPLPASLEKLNLTSNELTSFNPSQPLPASLQSLDLFYNQLTSFNPSQPLPASLQSLDLSYNQLTSFNPSQPLPASLEKLYFINNQLTSFNPSRPLPTSLTRLCLEDNELRLGSIVFQNPPPPYLRLYVLGNPFIAISSSPDIWLRVPSGMIQDIPEGSLRSMGIEVIGRNPTSDIAASLQNELAALMNNGTPLTSAQKEEFKEILTHSQASILATFVQRMRMSWEKYNSDVLSCIRLANTNPQFREVLFNEVFSTSTHCHDRPLYFFNRLSVQAKAYEAQSENNAQKLVQALSALKHIKILEDYALEVFEEEALEVALYLQLRLKHTLQLPMAITSMANDEFAQSLIQTHVEQLAPPKKVEEWIEEKCALCMSVSANKEDQIAILAESPILQSNLKLPEDHYVQVMSIFDASHESEDDDERTLSPSEKTIIQGTLPDFRGDTPKDLKSFWVQLNDQQQTTAMNTLMSEREKNLAVIRKNAAMKQAEQLWLDAQNS